MAHTPGPYTLEHMGNVNGVRMSWLVKDKLSIGTRNVDDESLLTAAPDMLAALVALRDLKSGTEMTYEDAYDSMFKSGGREAWGLLDAAIAKAVD